MSFKCVIGVTFRQQLKFIAASLLCCLSLQTAMAQVFINEIHYDNSGTDVGEAIEVAETTKARAHDSAATAADAASAAAAEFDPDSLQHQLTGQVAAHLRGVAGSIGEADIQTVANDVQRFARQNPLMFLGGAALLGFAAARFLKASDRTQPAPHHAHVEVDPWTGHVTEAYAAPAASRADQTTTASSPAGGA